MTKLEAQFRAALDKAFDRWIAQFTYDFLSRTLYGNNFIITGAKNIRCTGDSLKRRVTATLTVKRGPDFDREFEAKYVLTFNTNRKPAYKATITGVK